MGLYSSNIELHYTYNTNQRSYKMPKKFNELSKAKQELVKKEMYMVHGKLVDIEESTYRFTDNQKKGIDFSNIVFIPLVEVEQVSKSIELEDVDMLSLLIGG